MTNVVFRSILQLALGVAHGNFVRREGQPMVKG